MNELLLNIIKIIVATIYGLVIGHNREKLGKPAGYKTISVVSMSACLLVVIASKYTGEGLARMASQIIPGIGFIGAGVIMSKDNDVHGLTTAASILFAAAIGIACGTIDGVIYAGACVLLYLLIIKIFNSTNN